MFFAPFLLYSDYLPTGGSPMKIATARGVRADEIHAVPNNPEPAADPTALKRRSYYATGDDDQAVAAIRARYGLSTDSDAVRFALRLVAGDAVKWSIVPGQAKKIRLLVKLRPPGR